MFLFSFVSPLVYFFFLFAAWPPQTPPRTPYSPRKKNAKKTLFCRGWGERKCPPRQVCHYFNHNLGGWIPAVNSKAPPVQIIPRAPPPPLIIHVSVYKRHRWDGADDADVTTKCKCVSQITFSCGRTYYLVVASAQRLYLFPHFSVMRGAAG